MSNLVVPSQDKICLSSIAILDGSILSFLSGGRMPADKEYQTVILAAFLHDISIMLECARKIASKAKPAVRKELILERGLSPHEIWRFHGDPGWKREQTEIER